jgi:hypothetical protein
MLVVDAVIHGAHRETKSCMLCVYVNRASKYVT